MLLIPDPKKPGSIKCPTRPDLVMFGSGSIRVPVRVGYPNPHPIRYLLDNKHVTRIYPAQPFLGRSCQNQLMRSNNFDVNVPVTMCHEVEAQANNCKNKASLWTDFKYSFAWLTGMKKLIFDYNNCFGLSHSLTHDILKIRSKNDQNQKVIGIPKYVANM